jgi:predicted nucleotidyltransferase
MNRARNPNLQILELAVAQLGSLAHEMVFVGGCATGLLITDTAAPPIRVTQDVDVIAEVAAFIDYHRLSNSLRKRGFKEDTRPDAPICRWVTRNVILDVMPTKREILGFGNEWYQSAFAVAINTALPSGAIIRMVNAPHFLITKLCAFDDRGKRDYVMSHDMEDIIAVLDGRPEVVVEVQQSDSHLRAVLADRFTQLLIDASFEQAVPGQLPGDPASQSRAPLIFERMQQIAECK